MQLRFHLQRLHGLEARDVFGEESLVACARLELAVQALLEHGRDGEACHGNERKRRDCDQRQRHGVPGHDRQADHEEGQVEQQADCAGGKELADLLDALQARGDDPGRP